MRGTRTFWWRTHDRPAATHCGKQESRANVFHRQHSVSWTFAIERPKGKLSKVIADISDRNMYYADSAQYDESATRSDDTPSLPDRKRRSVGLQRCEAHS